jgi:hypothetical protein
LIFELRFNMKHVKHLVCLRFKDGTTPAQINEVFRSIGELRDKVPGMLDYSWGPNVSPEGLAQGHTHSLAMTFENAAARDGYLRHPAHQRVVENGLPLIASIIVLDHEV